MKNKLIYFFKISIFIALLLLAIIGVYINLSNRNNNSVLNFVNTPEENQFFKKYSYIAGGVLNPGVYEIKTNMILMELVNQAGGFTEAVNKESLNKSINLSEIVKENNSYYIPLNEYTPNIAGTEVNLLLNINTASIDELVELPGIGEATAQKIINARPFTSLESLLDVNGIGESKYNQIKELITL